eukprot:jgi/Chrzof1/10419/UNPLg00345.t1
MPDTTAAPGKCLGPWILEQQIGSGSFAVVWKARHQGTGTIAAVKEINTDTLNEKLQESLASEVTVLDQTKPPVLSRRSSPHNKAYSLAGSGMVKEVRQCHQVSMSRGFWGASAAASRCSKLA